MRPMTTLWLLPLGFVLHDGEELLTMVGWLARHRVELERWSSYHPTLERVVETAPSTGTELAITMVLELALLLVVTGAAARARSRVPLYAYAAALGVFVLHAGTHAALAVIWGGYVPGVATAVTVIPAVGIVSYRALLRSQLLSPTAAVASAIVGIAVFVPLFASFVHLARGIAARL